MRAARIAASSPFVIIKLPKMFAMSWRVPRALSSVLSLHAPLPVNERRYDRHYVSGDKRYNDRSLLVHLSPRLSAALALHSGLFHIVRPAARDGWEPKSSPSPFFIAASSGCETASLYSAHVQRRDPQMDWGS